MIKNEFNLTVGPNLVELKYEDVPQRGMAFNFIDSDH